MKKYIVLLILLPVLITSCVKRNETSEAKKDSVSVVKSDSIKKANENTNSQEEKPAIIKYDDRSSFNCVRSSSPVLAPEKLIEVCPKTISGFTKGANQTSTSEYDGPISKAGTFYKTAKSEYINLLITDFGPKNKVSSLEAFDNPSEETGWDVSTISSNTYRGYFSDCKFEKKQKLFVLYKNRYVVSIELIGFNNKEKDIRDILKLLNTKNFK